MKKPAERFRARVALLLGVFLVSRSAAFAATCESLTSLSLPETTILKAQPVAAGAFVPPAPARGRGAAQISFSDLPAFCRVEAAVKRLGDTDVKIEIWMPAQAWNGDFQPAASAFGGGTIGYGNSEGGMASFLRRGAATGATNRGHDSGGSPRWKSSDVSSTAYHLMVDRGKKIVTAFYGRGPSQTFMNECGGAGSRDALQLVQDYPGDLDMATAVGFTNWGTHHGIAQMWVYQATHKTAESFIPRSKLPVVHRAALNACDADDGLKDGIIEDPEHCQFDPGVLLCRNGDAPDCLTAAQVEAARTIYATPVHARTKAYLYGALPPGGELGWEEMVGETPYPFAVPFFRDQVFKDPAWNYKTRPVNFDGDVDLADGPDNLPINAINPDLRKFIDRGGKLLLMGGWNDHTLGPGNSVHYYQSIVATLGARKLRDAVRLFMVPGMDHCLGDAYGPSAQFPTDYSVAFEPIAFMKQWKAAGHAPESIVVQTKGRVNGRRLVCAYPKISRYNGSGDPANPANFSCTDPAKPERGHKLTTRGQNALTLR